MAENCINKWKTYKEHVEIDMTLLHSGMFGKCEIGHGPSIILLIL
jgi:hypothetical protein